MTLRPSIVALATMSVAASTSGLAVASEHLVLDLDTAIQAELKVADYTLTNLSLPTESGIGFFVDVQVNGQPLTLDLAPHSTRSPDFRLMISDGQGGLREIEAPAPMTYRGTTLESPDAAVSAAIVNGGLRARIEIDDETIFQVMPLAEALPGVDPSTHIVYHVRQGQPDGWICGNEILNIPHNEPVHVHAHGGGGGVGTDGEDVMVAEIAFDADFEFFQMNGSSVDDTVADIDAVMNDLNIIYDRDTFIRHATSTIIVRTEEPDPYSGNDAGGLLDQMRSHWNSRQRDVERDVAHLMTGKSINGGTIGLAYVGVICNRDWAYGLSESRFTSRVDWRVGLTAHELGHNWNAPHCNESCSGGPDCRIMCPCIASCSGDVSKFGAASIDVISSFRDSLSCLEIYNPFSLGVGTLISGQVANIDVAGAAPSADVFVYFSLRGEGQCPVQELGVVLEISNCRPAVSGTTDSRGVKTWSVRVPNASPGRPVALQAAQEGIISNVVLRRIRSN